MNKTDTAQLQAALETTTEAVTGWVLRIDLSSTILLLLGVVPTLLLLAWLWRKWRKPKKLLGEAEKTCGICARIAEYLKRLLEAIDYLATRREWRYAQPWVLVLGDRGAGKSSLIGSVSKELGQPPPPRARELKAPGMRWSYLQNGVLIDADGALWVPEEGQPAPKQWPAAVAALDALRPERALDGVVLCVSAHSLLNARRVERVAMAEAVNMRMAELQQGVDFMLPVYVVVTQCDAIAGFSSFWRSLDRDLQRDMFGFSASGHDLTGTPADWAGIAMERIGLRLRELQVGVSGSDAGIVDTDGFVLFPERFARLREPLAQWMQTVFRASAWDSGYLFRGVYFSGSVEADGEHHTNVRKDVDFVDGLLAQKVLLEKALAKPTRKGIWSRNKLIRRAQQTAVAAAVLMFVALGFAAADVSRQVDAITAGVKSLDQLSPRVPPPGTGRCLAREEIYPLLNYIGRIDTRSRYPAIPLSWIDGRLTSRSADVVGNKTVEAVLMPTFACLLEKRAADLLDASRLTRATTGAGLSVQRNEYRQLVQDARALEQNLKRYQLLATASDTMKDPMLLSTLDALAQYAFGEPLPRAAMRHGSVLDDAFRQLGTVREPVLRLGFRQRVAKTIDAHGRSLRDAMSREVAAGEPLLVALDQGESPILDNTRRLGLWLAWVQRSWMGSTAERNPCRSIVDANIEDIDALEAYHDGYAALANTLDRFNEKNCHRPSVEALAEMDIAPYGPLFLSDETGTLLSLAPRLQAELEGLPALAQLPFMQLQPVGEFQCKGEAAIWRASEVAEGAGYVAQYRDFLKARKRPQLPKGGLPLYERLAGMSLGMALDDTLRRAQRTPDGDDAAAIAPERSDAQLAASGEELTRGLESLLQVLAAYSEIGAGRSAVAVRQCARDFASDNLGGVDALAHVSQLYVPAVPSEGDAMYALPGVPVSKDYLARQFARAQVLGNYAQPFLQLLAGVSGSDDTWRDAPQTETYWRNTLDEIARYAKGKDPASQVGKLDDLVLGQLTGMTYENCAKTLAAYVSPEFGNELFSERRQSLERKVRLRCTNRREAEAEDVYGTLAARFNRELAGRYPFAEFAARDAGLGTVRDFFIDYAARRTEIGEAAAVLQGERGRAARDFLAALEEAAAFFAGNLAAPQEIAPIALGANFPADIARANGADQLLSWTLSVDDRVSVFPNGIQAMEWYPGERIGLRLRWAERSGWRPLSDPAQPVLRVQQADAEFTVDGAWALLRMIDLQRAYGRGGNGTEPIALRFVVPVQAIVVDTDAKSAKSDDKASANAASKPARSETRVFMTWRLQGLDPAGKETTPIALPVQFPRSAPQYWPPARIQRARTDRANQHQESRS